MEWVSVSVVERLMFSTYIGSVQSASHIKPGTVRATTSVKRWTRKITCNNTEK